MSFLKVKLLTYASLHAGILVKCVPHNADLNLLCVIVISITHKIYREIKSALFKITLV